MVFPLFGPAAFSGSAGKITGHVIDAETNDPLVVVNILIEGTRMGAATDVNGEYTILNVPPGTYNLRASTVGYKAVVYQQVKVSIDLTTTIDFNLTQSSILMNEEVVVAKRPAITKDLTSSTAIVDASKIDQLPITEFSQVLSLQAGVVGGSVRGGRGGEVVYAIDGVPMTDVYDGSNVIDVNPSTIQELEFVSGAFNAEYGRALSGYVNIATKDGGNKLTGAFTSYLGGYLSSHADIFPYINRINPLNTKDLEGTLSGPVINDVLSFYANGRYNYTGGWLYGKRVFNPWDITTDNGSIQPLETRYTIQETGDGAVVPMNWNTSSYLQGKLTYKPFADLKLSYNFVSDRSSFRIYNHMFSDNPDGDFTYYNNANANTLGLTHTLSSSTFYQASLSYFFKDYMYYVYQNVSDPRYTNVLLLSQQPQEVPSFLTGGTQNENFRRTTGTYNFKLDLTSQLSDHHQLKAGVDLTKYQLTFDDFFLLQPDGLLPPSTSLQPFVTMRVPDPNNPNENLSINQYLHTPTEFSAYAQDKIEFKAIVVNVGVRFDYFDPDGEILTDPADPDIYRPLEPQHIADSLNVRQSYWYKKATAKYQISPRLGVSFPITDKGAIHFSFGQFFQVPNFDYLYQNPGYKFGPGTGNLGIAGNPDLKPEQTISGEVGVQQALTDDLKFDITGYFRDIRNLTGTRADEIILYGGSARYSQYVNSDFGFVRGITLTITKQLSNGWSATLDYTLQTAQGDASDPAAIRNELASGIQPEVQLIPLNWDQRHTVNLTFGYVSSDNWGFSLIAKYGSGLPYTPMQSVNISDLLTNSELKPSSVDMDVRAYKDFMIGSYRLSIFARVYNLLDALNQLNVYNDSGTADFTEEKYVQDQQHLPAIVNTVDQYYTDPSYYSEPRKFEVGFSLFFN
jgi:outer membrane receptor for ferrienterochelin and colicin